MCFILNISPRIHKYIVYDVSLDQEQRASALVWFDYEYLYKRLDRRVNTIECCCYCFHFSQQGYPLSTPCEKEQQALAIVCFEYEKEEAVTDTFFLSGVRVSQESANPDTILLL